jgi:V8-like Glu-specific endopeptidase
LFTIRAVTSTPGEKTNAHQFHDALRSNCCSLQSAGHQKRNEPPLKSSRLNLRCSVTFLLVVSSFVLSASCGSTLDSPAPESRPPGIEAEVDLNTDVESGLETVTENVERRPALPTDSFPNGLLANDFAAIVALSNCSGSYVRFTTSKTTDRAMVLTNGHCYEGGTLPAGTAIANRASSRSFRILTADGQGNLGRVRASRILYGTMDGTDMLLYELTETHAQIAQRLRVEPLVIGDQRPAAGEAILIASGYWRRTYSCSIDKFIFQMREGTWTFTDSIKYSEPGCQVIGGTSGSPILRPSSRTVIGINNTGNMDGARCTVNNPCEIDAAGNVVVDKGGSYGQQLYQTYSCLNAQNAFDFTRAGCALKKP